MNLSVTYTPLPFSFMAILNIIVQVLVGVLGQIIMILGQNGLYHSRAQRMAIDFDHLEHGGYKFIGSRSIRAT